MVTLFQFKNPNHPTQSACGFSAFRVKLNTIMQDQNQTPYKVKYRATIGLFSSFVTKSVSADLNISNEDWLNMLYHEKKRAIEGLYEAVCIIIDDIETIE